VNYRRISSATAGEQDDHGHSDDYGGRYVCADGGSSVQPLTDEHGCKDDPVLVAISVMFAAWCPGGRWHQVPPSRLVAVYGDRTLPRERPMRLVPLALPRIRHLVQVPVPPLRRSHLVSPGRSPATSTAPSAALLGTHLGSHRGNPRGHRQGHRQHPTIALVPTEHELVRCQEPRAPRQSSRTRT
jgi:hypothetical protein